MSETPKASLLSEEELNEWGDAPPRETVKVGKRELVIEALNDPATIYFIVQIAESRQLHAVDLGDGKKIKPTDAEARIYSFLEKGIVAEIKVGTEVPLSLTFPQLLQLSRKRVGFDLMLAGQRLMEISGLVDDAVDQAKNGSRGGASPSTEIQSASEAAGSAASSLPA